MQTMTQRGEQREWTCWGVGVKWSGALIVVVVVVTLWLVFHAVNLLVCWSLME